ncbi:type I phosphodiesterase/nucleotide pyrophosphatase [Candidatus Magnetoovum chiemensis]|nr:type I phosphodiesterase/nucleotide pyrophosphatase [Candidatus Magnetoovum chiemensis]
MTSNAKMMIIGLDGATYDIINPLIEAGELPNLAKLMEKGSAGTLNSTNPDLSACAWTSFMTGKHPGKHAILDFFAQKPRLYDTFMYNASYRQGRPLWTILGQKNKRVCVVNVPMTYPPDAVNGVMISGMDTPDIKSDFIYPSSLREELDKNIGGYMLERTHRNITKNIIGKQIKHIFEVSQNRFNAVKYIMQTQQWDFFAVVFEATDRSQHNFWKFMDPKHPDYNSEDYEKYGSVIKDVYKDMDSKVGELISMLPDECTTIVMSDHGFGPIYKSFRLNTWLENNNYLSFKEPFKTSLSETIKIKAKRLLPESLKTSLKAIVPKSIAPKSEAAAFDYLKNIDMSRSKVYTMGGYGHVCINLKGRQPMGIVEQQDYDNLRNELIEKLLSLKDPETGQNIIYSAQKRENLYSVFPDNTPDIIIKWADCYTYIGDVELSVLEIKSKKDELFTIHRWSGNHRLNGIVMFDGRNIKKGEKLPTAQIIDIAPTVLYLMGTPVPDDMDGKVITSAIDEQFLKDNPIKYEKASDDNDKPSSTQTPYTYDENEDVVNRLRDLGYIE